MTSSFQSVRFYALLAFALAVWACDSDETASGQPDAAQDVGAEDGGRDIAVDAEDAGADPVADAEDVEDVEDVADDVAVDAPPDLVVEDVDREGVFPEEPTGPCIEGGDGARGRIEFDDGTPLVGATIALLFEDQKHLGVTDDSGQFYVRAQCGEVAVEVGIYESENQPTHPSLWNLPVGTFDAASEEPTLQVPLVAVEGVIVDVLREPIEGAILKAELRYGNVRVLNRDEADEDGTFAVNLVPWSLGPYDLTAEGPQDSEKRYRTATLRVLIGDPPPDPSTFILYEDRCEITGTFHTSEGTDLEWLYIRADGEPYTDGAPVWYSFERGIYYPQGESANLLDNVPLFCGPQTLRLWNAIWLNPDWPCKMRNQPEQLCLNNFPLWVEQNLTEPQDDGVEIEVVRIGGSVEDEYGLAQRDVIVTIEGCHQWGDTRFDYWTTLNEVVSDEAGNYSMVIIPEPGSGLTCESNSECLRCEQCIDGSCGHEYLVTARIRDDDRRPLGGFEGTVSVSEPTTYDIVLPEGPPRCIMTGTVHSSEGRVFNEVLLYFWGTKVDPEPDEDPALYSDEPWQFFTEEPGIYYRFGFSEEEVPFVPFLCGEHDLGLHSSDWESCNMSPDEICFTNWSWWSNEIIDEPILDGIEIPVVHLSGRVMTVPDDPGEVARPVSGASVTAMAGFPPFTFVQNGTGTGPDGIYDMVVLPGLEWTVSVSVGDDHPDNPCEAEADGSQCQLQGADAAVLVEEATEVGFEMPDGPKQCPFSGVVRTSDDVVLESLDFWHFGAYYGMFGWRFRSIVPGEYFRYPNDTIILDRIPLLCGIQNETEPAEWVQDFIVDSIWSTRLPSCIDPNKFDQPCLGWYRFHDDLLLTEPLTGDLVVPVVRVSGTVTLEDGSPIRGAEVEAVAQICLEQDEEGSCILTAGQINNFAVTRPDGRYQVDVVPSELSEYSITITTPLEVDLGQVTFNEVIVADTVIDARFSLVE